MCYKKVIPIFFVFLFLFASVQGSCLEYGHSCWGAHGKRSGSVFRGGSDLTTAELQLLPNQDERQAAASSSTSSLSSSNKVRPSTDDVLSPPPLQGLFERFPDAGESSDGVNINGNDDESQASSKRSHAASKLRRLMRQRHAGMRSDSAEEAASADRWHRVPIFQLKKFPKQPSSGSEGRVEQDLFAAGQRKEQPRPSDEGGYFDYK